jgi:hypothetical protein
LQQPHIALKNLINAGHCGRELSIAVGNQLCRVTAAGASGAGEFQAVLPAQLALPAGVRRNAHFDALETIRSLLCILTVVC